MSDATSNVLSIRDLKTYFFLDEGTVRAVDGVNLEVPKGKTIGIVGESGCGKSVSAFSTLRLVTSPGEIVEGEIVLHRENGDVVLTDLEEEGEEIRSIRGREISMIFQEPMTSLSPVHRVGNQIVEAVELHTDMVGQAAMDHAIHMLERVGIPDAPRRAGEFPFELSGGMRQRVMIAMALSCQPSLLIADEPTTALDVTIQAQILELMRELQEEYHMSIMLITHDLGVVAEVADEVAVMYLGRVVEQGSVERIFEHPQHPYTKALMRSIPGVGGDRKSELQTIEGSIPDPFTRLPGCPFHPRCQDAIEGVCSVGERPELITVEEGHDVACVLYREEVARG
ncbi:MAG: dipeptide/oligopeptide/nickel ABC transporter ATP-binding protein [Gemmatimonadetes bacterium]|nr:dipeptide/oligopeptide/nickel ABC transporter ATP-binding protein [Gemmatimonadota bacterium]